MSDVVIKGNASGTGSVTIESPNTNSDYTLTLPTETGTVLTNNGNQAGTFSSLTVNSNNISADNSLGFRNRIINGDMRIDQRNAGASVTPAAGAYTLDRWEAAMVQASKYSVQQNAGSVTLPAGFTNYLGCTSTSSYSVLTGDSFGILQRIEGFNCADFGWGTANAAPITISFLVRSSLTGTFGGVLKNSAANRSYPFSYLISSANTWEQKSIMIAGDTSGTWLTNNGTGINLKFSLGAGATLSATAGSWAGANYDSSTGAVSVVGTSGATFYITGVQLEVGSVATPFERRPYGTELQLCQRYYQNGGASLCGTTEGTTIYSFQIQFLQEMRTAPTSVARSGQYFNVRYSGGDVSILNPTTVVANTTSTGGWGYVTSSGLTANLPIVGRQQNSGQSNFIGFSAEL